MRVIAVSLVLLAGSVACGGPEAQRPAAAPAVAEETAEPRLHEDCDLAAGVGPRLAAVDNSFGPDCLTVRSDAVLYVQNFGTYDHSFTISEGELGRKPFTIDVHLPGRDTKPRPVELDGVLDVGTYDFYCKLHGSMDGTLEVIAPASS